MKKIVLLPAVCICLFACNPEKETRADLLSAHLDTTVKPGDDFFLYANGGWIKKTPIPGSESGWGIGNLVEEEIYTRLKKINEDAAANADKATPGSTEQQIGDFWKTAMDSAALNAAGIKPLQPDLDKITAVKDIDGLMELAAVFKTKGVHLFFGDYVAQDDKNSEAMAYKMDQGGLGMPSRDYYFDTDERTLKVRAAYKKYLATTFKQLGNDADAAEKNTTAVYTIETLLAKASRKLADLRDPYKNYNKMHWSGLAKIAPNINWTGFATITGVAKTDSVIVGQPEFFSALSTALATVPLEDWKNYVRFHLLSSNADYFDDVTFMNAFTYGQSMSGASEPRQRWKRVLDNEGDAIGEALGQLFVKEYFNEAAKKRYSDMVEAVRTAYKERIAKLDWMSDSTKQKAYDKLAKISKKVGYPDKWKDFSSLKIDRSSYYNNMQQVNLWWHNYRISKLGKPVDRTEWEMTPQTYNAYYNPSNNEIVLPAGIFAVPGFRDEELDDALVYGYAGASTIGHEITHGFDDQGRQYDAYGNLVNWWTKKDEAAFTARAKFIIRQFNEFVPVDTMHINGEATQGENIADLGGMLIGLDAFKKTEAYKKNETIGGLNALQRYFLGYALGWMYQVKKERLASRIKTDVHAPAKERVNGPVVNIPEFYQAFNIKPGDKMYRADSLRVHIW